MKRFRFADRRKLIIFSIVMIAAFVISLLTAEYIAPWVEGFGKAGYLGIFIVAFVSNATIFFPLSGLPFITAFTSGHSLGIFFIVIAIYTFGAVLGELTGYILGLTERKIITVEQVGFIKRWKEKFTMDALVFIIALQPVLPFDALGIFAGNIRYSLPKFLIFCFLGRFIKYTIVLFFFKDGIPFF